MTLSFVLGFARVKSSAKRDSEVMLNWFPLVGCPLVGALVEQDDIGSPGYS